ncbi:hypothetical protein CR513_49048, partial [Mucuna pruriens]
MLTLISYTNSALTFSFSFLSKNQQIEIRKKWRKNTGSVKVKKTKVTLDCHREYQSTSEIQGTIDNLTPVYTTLAVTDKSEYLPVKLPSPDIPTDPERTVSINGRINNLIVAKIFFIPIAYADFSPLLHFEAKAFLYDLLHRRLSQVLIVLSFRVQPQIQRIPRHLQTVHRTLQLPPIRMVPKSDEGVQRILKECAEYLRHVLGVSELEDEAPFADAELQRVRRTS